MASAKMASAIDVRIDDVGSILKFRNIGFAFGENSAGFCQSVWLLESILNFRIGSVSSIGGLLSATLFADTISDSQNSEGQLSLNVKKVLKSLEMGPRGLPAPGGRKVRKELLREAKPGGFQTRVFPAFFGKGPDCVADPFGTVPRRCSS